MVFSIRNSYRGAFIYALGDALASCVLDEFSLQRVLGMMVIGGTLYAFEIPNYFAWIESKTSQLKGAKKSVIKTTLALLFFNPLWIARHLLIIQWLNTGSMHYEHHILHIALISFLWNIPISLLANFLIQNTLHLKYRFMGSAVFSGLMAIYYALSASWFD